MKTSFTEQPPVKSAQEMATKAIDKTGAFFMETNQKYQITQKTTDAAAAAKTGIMSLWGRAKTLVAKNPNSGSARAAAAQVDEAPAAQDASSSEVEESVKEPLNNQEKIEEIVAE